MNSVLVIGLGRFGRHLSKKLASLGNEVMIADHNEEAVAELADTVTYASICDCCEEASLHALGVHNFDLCFVCIGSDFAASLLITSMLRDLGARRIISKASHDTHARLLLKNGADEVVYPERDIAERIAVRTSTKNVFDYVELTDQYGIYEIPVLQEWVDKSIAQISIRNRHHINILAVKTSKTLQLLPDADYVFTGKEHVLALSSSRDIQKLLRKS